LGAARTSETSVNNYFKFALMMMETGRTSKTSVDNYFYIALVIEAARTSETSV
jgi:hypothetical protein